MSRRRVLQAFWLLAVLHAGPAFAQAEICRTPDGFVAAHGTGNGIGGTGSPWSNGIGGTGLRADIGVYGRITGFGSICVNGMEIEYDPGTPVSGAGTSRTDDLAVGQVVAVQAYEDGKGFSARKITVVNTVSGPVSRLDLRRGELTVLGRNVIAGENSASVLKELKEGDVVSVSGLLRADGVIMAGHIQKIPDSSSYPKTPSATPFDSAVKLFSVQGYVQEADEERLSLSNGANIVLPDTIDEHPAYNERVIVFGHVDDQGAYIGDSIITEVVGFSAVFHAPLPGETEGGAPAVPQDEPVAAPPVDIPDAPLDVPEVPLDIPELPVDLPEVPVDIEVPVLPVDIPVLP